MVPLILELTKKHLNINATLFQHIPTAHFACAGYFSFARIISHIAISFFARIEKLIFGKSITGEKYAVVTSTSVLSSEKNYN